MKSKQAQKIMQEYLDSSQYVWIKNEKDKIVWGNKKFLYFFKCPLPVSSSELFHNVYTRYDEILSQKQYFYFIAFLYKNESYGFDVCEDLDVIPGYSVYKADEINLNSSIKDISIHLKDIIDEFPSIMILANLQGEIAQANATFTRLIGYDKQEIIGKNLSYFIYHNDAAPSDNIVYHEDKTRHFKSFVVRFLKRDNEYITIDWSTRYSKQYNCLIITGTDITYREKVEAENLMFKHQHELDELRTQFFANISHDLKTPINVLLSASQLLEAKLEQDKYNKDELIKINRHFQNNSYRLYRMIINMLDLVRMDNQYFQLYINKVNMIGFVQLIVQSIQPYLNDKHMTVKFHSTLKELYMDVDIIKIDRIILNVISNSIKFSKPNTTIHIHLVKEKNLMKLSIQDEGEGVEEEAITHIFDRFQKGNNARGNEGSGLGLSIVKSLVELHKGTVSMTSQCNKGTTVTICLPIFHDDNVVLFNIDDAINLQAIMSNLKMELSDI